MHLDLPASFAGHFTTDIRPFTMSAAIFAVSCASNHIKDLLTIASVYITISLDLRLLQHTNFDVVSLWNSSLASICLQRWFRHCRSTMSRSSNRKTNSYASVFRPHGVFLVSFLCLHAFLYAPFSIYASSHACMYTPIHVYLVPKLKQKRQMQR